MNGEIMGHSSVMDSQTPSASSAAVAGERNSTENNIAMPSHAPAYAIEMKRNTSERENSSPLGGTPRKNTPNPTTRSHRHVRLTARTTIAARNFPASNASR